MLAKAHVPISVFTHSDHVLRGLPFFLVPGSWKFVICLIQDVAHCTWPYHLSHWQWRTDVMSSMPSFSSSEAKGASSLSLMPLIQRIIAWSLRQSCPISGSFGHPSFFSCDQAALQTVFSVRLSVCLSVRLSVTPFWLCSHHRIIMKFSGVITNDQRKVHAKGQGQRSKVKVTEVTTPLNRFRTVTPVWIHIWWWNYACSLMLLRRGALLFLKVICQISRSHGSKNRRIWPRLVISGR